MESSLTVRLKGVKCYGVEELADEKFDLPVFLTVLSMIRRVLRILKGDGEGDGGRRFNVHIYPSAAGFHYPTTSTDFSYQQH